MTPRTPLGHTLRDGAPPDHPPALTAIGTPLTWTGKVVSWAEWGRMGAWERFGPDGRVWCGVARAWRMPTEAEAAQDAAERQDVSEVTAMLTRRAAK